ncbi:MAG: SDR family NAD(P)-dependent oxidoreductase [Rhodospirillales bacterium]|nr:SDR family NAD(P)-dependent oxidoreductase [Rhodospirillales bacterium]
MSDIQHDPQEWDALPRMAWITGAGKGIGRALAERLAGLGWTVYASARTLNDLNDLAAATDELSGEVRPLPLDINDRDACARAVAHISNDGQPLGLVVLNAGTHTPTPAGEFDAEVVGGLISTNLTGTVNCLAPAMKMLMQQGRGHIAVVASLAGYRGLPRAAAYSASKAGLIAMAEALYPELYRSGVGISVINPGFVKTPLTDKNTFEMPCLIEVDEAVDAIIKGLARQKFEIAFPTRFVMIMRLLRALPYALYFKLTGKILNR